MKAPREGAQLAQAWDDWAQVDPHYAILADPARWAGGWIAETNEFFRSGDEEVALLLEQSRTLRLPASWTRALDFGCGLGRVTQALAPHFEWVVGVDVAPTMVTEARRLHAGVTNVEFRQVSRPLQLCDEHYDLVWSVLVLQHLGSAESIVEALRVLATVLSLGGLLVVEIPHQVPTLGWRGRLRLRTRTYQALRRLGVSPTVLRHRLRLTPPMTMSALPEDRVRAELADCGLDVLRVTTNSGVDGVEYRRYFATRGRVS